LHEALSANRFVRYNVNKYTRIRNNLTVGSYMGEIGRFLIVVGLVVTVIGFLLWSGFAPRWLGRLPGDIRIERGNFGFYFPIVTCIVLSIILTLIFSLFRR
jgi:Protein of unknown function (DUF2905)